MTRLSAIAAVLALVVGIALPAFAEVTFAEVEAAREELRRLSRDLEARVEEYERAVVEESLLRDRLDAMEVAVTARERELTLARVAARDRAAFMYMSAGSGAGAATLMSSGDLASEPARLVYLDSVAETDLEVVIRLEAARRDYVQQRALLDEAVAAQADVRADMDALLDDIYAELEAANSRYRALKDEWEEQERERVAREIFLSTSTTTTTTTRPPPTTTTTGAAVVVTTTSTLPPPTTVAPPPPPPPPPPTSPGTMVCPVDGAVTFRDSWGEPRSGGRTHSGVDMMAPHGTPLVAIESGTIFRISSHSLGGLGIYVLGESGGLWYYAHNQAIEAGIAEGDAVVAGQRIAYVGSSGNASADAPHVHFGWMPNADWVYANPFPIVDSLCR